MPPPSPLRSRRDPPRPWLKGLRIWLGAFSRTADRTTYVMAAFRGASYARSAEDASGLIEANAAALVSVGLPLDFLTGMTKLTVGVWFFFFVFFC